MRRIMDNPGAQILREAFKLRSRRQSYSLRAFARDLGISHTYLSLILNDKKRLPMKTFASLSAKLGFTHESLSELGKLTSTDATGRKSREFARLEVDRFRLMSQWYYVAILDLIEIPSFPFSVAHVAEYFSLPRDDIRESLAVLRRLGLVQFSKGKWTKTDNRLSVVAPTSQASIRSYHRQMIFQAFEELSKINEADFKLRDITGMTMAINPKRIGGAKRKIARFRRSLEAYLTQGECTEVYQFNIQLFPLRGAGKRQRKFTEDLC